MEKVFGLSQAARASPTVFTDCGVANQALRPTSGAAILYLLTFLRSSIVSTQKLPGGCYAILSTGGINLGNELRCANCVAVAHRYCDSQGPAVLDIHQHSAHFLLCDLKSNIGVF